MNDRLAQAPMMDTVLVPVRRIGTTHVPSRLPELPLRPMNPVRVGDKQRLRDVPYFVRGRDAETAAMLLNLQTMPHPIQVIVGPPGSGKSSILANVRQFAREWGSDVVRLRSEDFATDTTLANALLSADLGESGREADEKEQRLSGEIEASALFAKARGSIEGTKRHGPVAPDKWRQALIGRADRNSRGLLITIDETQAWGEEQDASVRKRMRVFLETMQARILEETSFKEGRNPKVDDVARLKAMLVCGGLPDTVDVLSSFGISRIENEDIMHLGPISATASAEVIHDHMQVPTLGGEQLPPLPQNMLNELAAGCHGCAHHLAAAGFATQQIGARMVQRQQTEWSRDCFQELLDRTQKLKDGLYSRRWKALGSSQSEKVAGVLATVVERWEGRLPVAMVEELAVELSGPEGAPESEALALLIQKGVLELRDVDHIYPSRRERMVDRSYYTFGIPTMADWCTRVHDPVLIGQKVTSPGPVHRALQRGPSPDELIAEWDWDAEPQLPELEMLPLEGGLRPEQDFDKVAVLDKDEIIQWRELTEELRKQIAAPAVWGRPDTE